MIYNNKASVMPLHTENYFNKFNLLAIDPGLNNTGLAIFEIDYYNRKIISIQANTIITDKVINKTGLTDEEFPDRLIKLMKLKQSLRFALMNSNPCIVACEAPFFNRFRPNAYGALVEVMNTIQMTILDHNHGILFYKVEPLLVKKCVGAGSMKGKLDVKACVSNIPEITNVLLSDINSLDEHSIDAIAVGYSYLKLSGECSNV